MAKCPYGEISYDENSNGECSAAKKFRSHPAYQALSRLSASRSIRHVPSQPEDLLTSKLRRSPDYISIVVDLCVDLFTLNDCLCFILWIVLMSAHLNCSILLGLQKRLSRLRKVSSLPLSIGNL